MDGLLIDSTDPKVITVVLTNKNYFTLKGTGPISYYLCCHFGRNDDGNLHFATKKHVETIADFYCNMFGFKPKLSFSSPLEKDGHPDSDDAHQHESMMCAIKFTVSLVRLKVNTAVITLAYFKAEPRQGNLDCCKTVVSCLAKLKWATIRIRTKEPDLSSISTTPCN